MEIIYIYRVGHEKVARLPFAFAFGYCMNFVAHPKGEP
jgi:hypothetical protein